MKADVTLGTTTFVGVEGKTISEILDKVCREHGLSDYGRSKLTYKIREGENNVT